MKKYKHIIVNPVLPMPIIVPELIIFLYFPFLGYVIKITLMIKKIRTKKCFSYKKYNLKVFDKSILKSGSLIFIYMLKIKDIPTNVKMQI